MGATAEHTRVIVIGAGPAGLTAAYLLTRACVDVTVLEANPNYVGGISRTEVYKGYRFDIGGHRFFSKSEEIESLWSEILPNDMLVRPRSSRIYYHGKFFPYPLSAVHTLRQLGAIETARCLLSYLRARVKPARDPRTFEQWVTNQFGRRLFEIFFRTYTEKVWGVSCSQISADWAAQRIRGLSLLSAIRHALKPRVRGNRSGTVIRTLIDSFRYPRLGPGMMWETCSARTREQGGNVRLGHTVSRCCWNQGERRWTVTHVDEQGRLHETTGEHVISSAPLRQLAGAIEPPLSTEARAAAASLKYRDFLTVMLIMRDRGALPDNWIYIHDPGVKVGRIQNFKSWSPELVPDPDMVCYGMEYFCFEGDGLWLSTDAQLLELALTELEKIGLGSRGDFVDGCVVRQEKAYPVYDDDYAARVRLVAAELEAGYPGLHLVGRNGMHKYNNQDHAMMTAILSVRNILAGERKYDVWRVNQDAEYQESGYAGELRDAAGGALRSVPVAARCPDP